MIEQIRNKVYGYTMQLQTKWFKVMYLLFIVFYLFDIVSTRYWTTITGAKEWNPVMHNIVEHHYWIFIVLKLFMLYIDIYLVNKYLNRNRKNDRKIVYISVYAMAIFYVLVAISNTIVILHS